MHPDCLVFNNCFLWFHYEILKVKVVVPQPCPTLEILSVSKHYCICFLNYKMKIIAVLSFFFFFLRLDRSELLCNTVLLKYKGDRESF